MITIKSYTDIQQSKKLAEILPLESADMGWNVFVDDSTRCLPIDDWDLSKNGEGGVELIPCWSLAALLGIFENNGFFYKLYFDGVSNVLEVTNIDNRNIHEIYYDDYPVDACYEMIIRLNELKLL